MGVEARNRSQRSLEGTSLPRTANGGATRNCVPGMRAAAARRACLPLLLLLLLLHLLPPPAGARLSEQVVSHATLNPPELWWRGEYKRMAG